MLILFSKAHGHFVYVFLPLLLFKLLQAEIQYACLLVGPSALKLTANSFHGSLSGWMNERHS